MVGLFKYVEKFLPIIQSSVARWSRPISTDERVENAPFTVMLAIANVVEGCNKS